MRVVQIITSLTTGGAETMLKNVVSHADRAAHEFMVVSLGVKAAIGAEIERAGVPVIALGGRGGVLLPHQWLRLIRLLRSWRPDVIHSWMYHSNVAAHLVRWTTGARRPRLIASVRGA